MSFKLISTNRDGRIIRQMFATELGSVGCLVLVSTTIYHDASYQAESGKFGSVGQMPIEDLIATVPIDKIEESLAYVPGVKLGENGLVPMTGFGYTAEPAPQVPDDQEATTS